VPALDAVRAERRLEAVRAEVSRRGLDSLLVADLVRPGDSSRDSMANVTWLSGFGGTSGCVVVSGDGTSDLFLTDFRYAEQARAVVPGAYEVTIAPSQLLPAIVDSLSGRVGFDPGATSVRMHERLADSADGAELVPAAGIIEELRRVKDAGELAAIAAAAELGDAVYAEVERHGLEFRSERDVAIQIETTMREMGAEAPSFPPIVAAGPNGALPHAIAGEREIGAGELVVIDLGVILDGYCSDCTRTFAAGKEPDEDATEAYEVVLRAQRRALEGVRAGIGGREADELARDVIEAAGFGDQFGHGLGHGVGIQVHEAPRLGKTSEDTLADGDVVTIEPGVYVEGRFGIRIEDLCVVGEDGLRVLTARPTELTVV
jgi:Xaa-Pro aminopeptidase